MEVWYTLNVMSSLLLNRNEALQLQDQCFCS